MSGVVALPGVLRRYDWGSTTTIQRLLGLQEDGRPVAELWFGAHFAGSATVDSSTLDAAIDADPAATLGAAALSRFGPRMPYLLKVLAVGHALSIQVHPDLVQAQAGFAAEEAAGIPRDARNRNYRDANHKPELLCAVTPFEALCGFREAGATRELIAELDLPELGFLDCALQAPDPLRNAFTAVLTHGDPAAVSTALGRRVASEGPDVAGGVLRGVSLAATDFPGDVGVVLALLLNYVRLEPGEAIYLGAGNVHAYLRGTGIEIMANSDNVLRCGLTAKYIDVDELLAITDFSALADPRLPAVGDSFDVTVRDFRLARIELVDPIVLDDQGPDVVLCMAGSATVGDLTLTPGQAAFLPAVQPAVTVDGTGLVFVAGARP